MKKKKSEESRRVNNIVVSAPIRVKEGAPKGIDMSNFEEEPLKEAVWRLKIEHDDFLARADSKIDTAIFIKYLHFCIKRNEVINLSIRGRVRSGKSLSAMAIAMKISEITGVPFLPEKHIKFSWEDYMNELNDTKEIRMHSVYVIDEKEEMMGMGSYAEQVAQLNVQRICAKMCIHTISLVGDYTILNINSVYNLATRERDFEKFETRLILHNVENQEEIPLCSIIIPIKKVLCDTILNRESNPVGKVISGCVLCHKFNNAKLCPDNTFLKRYEKAKDANIERVMKGGSASARQKLREDMAYKLLEDKLYATAHSKEEMKVLANKLLPRLTNRQFTMDEVDDIVVMTRIIKRDRLEKSEKQKSDVLNQPENTLLKYTTPSQIPLKSKKKKSHGKPRDADSEDNSEE